MENQPVRKTEETINLRVESDILGHLKILQHATFDPAVHVDENVQNADRAGAENFWVDINVTEKVVTMSNDGEVLSDMSKLFMLAKTGWNEKVQEKENPFGIGFFSNMTVSDHIQVHSGNQFVDFYTDLNHPYVAETGQPRIFMKEIEEYFDGFKLILNNYDFDKFNHWELEKQVELLGEHSTRMNIHLNGNLIERKDIFQVDNDVNASITIDEENVKGWIGLSRWFTDEVQIFHRGRLVSNLQRKYYLKGELHIEAGVLTLRAPDRKAYLKDEKLDEFQELVSTYIEQICIDVILDGNQETIDKLQDAISMYMNPSDALRLLKFKQFDGADKKQLEYLRKIAYRKKEESENLAEIEAYLEEDTVQETQEDILLEIVPEPEEFKKEYYNTSTGYESFLSSSSYTSIAEKKNTQYEERIIDTTKPIFWVRFGEIDTYLDKLMLLDKYKLNLVLIRNKFEEKVIQQCNNAFHLGDLNEDIKFIASLDAVKLNVKEQRASMLLEMISRMAGFEENIFIIGNLMVTSEVEVKTIGVTSTSIEEDIVALYDEEQDKIFIDRSSIHINLLADDLTPELNLNDYKFILANIHDLVAQIEMKKSQTKDLYSAILKALAFN